MSRGPHFSQKGKGKAKKIGLRGPDVARGPYVAPSCIRVLLSVYVPITRPPLLDSLTILKFIRISSIVRITRHPCTIKRSSLVTGTPSVFNSNRFLTSYQHQTSHFPILKQRIKKLALIINIFAHILSQSYLKYKSETKCKFF